MRGLIIIALACGLAHAQTQPNYAAQIADGSPSNVLNFNSATYSDTKTGEVWTATGSPSEVIGYDSTNAGNQAASLPSGAYITAPNASIGSYEWTQPYALIYQIDRLSWPRAGTQIVLSKGDFSGGFYNGVGYYLNLVFDNGTAQICFEINLQGGFQNEVIEQCTSKSGSGDIPNGYNYNIIVTNDGTGSPTALHLYLNGTDTAQYLQLDNGRLPGMVQIAYSGGTGYANSTPFTITGNGCQIAGTMTASGGVPNGITYSNNYGCRGILHPTVTLTGATGTGVTLTATANTASMISTQPMRVSGYIDGSGIHSGVGSGGPPLITDELALFPSIVDQYLVQSLFVHTKFYQTILGAPPAVPTNVIFSNDGCADFDNLPAFALTISLARKGYLRILAVTNTENGATSIPLYRQMLDSAGMNHIPLAVPSSFAISGGTTTCPASAVTAYNASTPAPASAYPQASTVYRTVLTRLPAGQTVAYLLGGAFRDGSDFLQSAPDGISSMSGAQIWAARISGGYLQGGVPPPSMQTCSSPCDNSLIDWQAGQYVLANNSSVPLYYYGGEPPETGPGYQHTRPPSDPLRLTTVASGIDARKAFDSLITLSLVTSVFHGTYATGTASVPDSTHFNETTVNGQHYFGQFSSLVTLAGGNIFTWFLNSLINVAPEARSRAY